MSTIVSTAIHRLHGRALIRLSGEDVRGFLQSLVTNDVTGSLPLWAGLLTPQGKVLFDFVIWQGRGFPRDSSDSADSADSTESDGDLLIDCEAAVASALIQRLNLYRLRRSITIAVEPRLAVHWSAEKPQASQASHAVADPRLAELGWRWLAWLAEDSATGDATGGAGADSTWQAHRLALGVAEGQAELGAGALLWLECNAAELNGVRFDKGCYIGQENTARMNWRAKINRRLVVVPIAEANPDRQRIAYPALGWSVEHRRLADIEHSHAPAWLREALTRPASE